MIVNTKSDRVLNVRRLVIELLLARCPESEVLQKLAKELCVEQQARFVADTDKGKCILCRSCVRVCEEVVGVSAIGLFPAVLIKPSAHRIMKNRTFASAAARVSMYAPPAILR